MNGNFWGHLVKAIGYAVVGAADDEGDQPAPRRAARRTASFGSTKGKKCCTAKRGDGGGSSGAPAVAPAPGANFGKLSPLRPKRGGG